MQLAKMLTPEGRREFLEARQAGIGSSDIAAIAGLDEYNDAVDVYYEKTRPVEDQLDQPQSIHAVRGIITEDLIAQLYMWTQDRKVRRVGQRAHPDYPWAACNIDRQIFAVDDRGTGALEVKAPSTGVFQRVIETGLDDRHLCQIQWQLFVTGYQWGEFAVGNLEHSAGPLQVFPVERNDELIGQLLERAEKFWAHVENREPIKAHEWVDQPDIEVPDHDKERKHVRRGEDPKLDQMIDALFEARRERDRWNDAYDERADEFKELMDDVGVTRLQTDLGKINYGHRKGRVRVALDKAQKAGLLDPDLVTRRLKKLEEELDRPLGIDQLVADCKFDWTAVEYATAAHRHFQLYPDRN